MTTEKCNCSSKSKAQEMRIFKFKTLQTATSQNKFSDKTDQLNFKI